MLNGYRMVVPGWGRVFYPTWPGQYHVQVHVPYLIPPRFGPADVVVQVPPGRLVELEYRVPLWTFSRGSLGPPPQKYNGMGMIIASAALALVIAFVAVVVIIAAA